MATTHPGPAETDPADPAAPPLSAERFSATVTAITSAFGDPTRRQIYLFAHASGHGVTAAEVAEQFGLHPNVARHHLDKLAAGGYLEVQVARSPGAGAGRPSKRYSVTAQDVTLDFPLRRDDLVITLLTRALDRLEPAEAEAMAEEVGIEYGRVMAQSLQCGADGQRTFRAALHAVADALTAHGFAAHTEGRGSHLRIVSESCPFGGAGAVSPVVCAVDRGMVKGMLSALYGDTAPETARSRALGDDSCVTAVHG